MKNWIVALLLASVLPVAAATAERRVELSVPEMSCPACPVTIRKTLERLDGVKVESASLETKRVIVHAPETVTDGELVNAVRDAGYTPAVVAPKGQ